MDQEEEARGEIAFSFSNFLMKDSEEAGSKEDTCRKGASEGVILDNGDGDKPRSSFTMKDSDEAFLTRCGDDDGVRLDAFVLLRSMQKASRTTLRKQAFPQKKKALDDQLQEELIKRTYERQAASAYNR